MPKKIVQDIARQVRELGGEVIKEGARQPVKLVEIAAEQIGMLPREWGEELGAQISTPKIKEKREKEEKKLKFWRRRKRELETRPSQAEPKTPPKEIEKQRELAEEAEEKKPLPEVPGKKPRGLLFGLRRRTEKSRPELAGRRAGG